MEDDANVPDRAEDIKPQKYHHRARTQGMGASEHTSDNIDLANFSAMNTLAQQGSDSDEEDEGDDDSTTEWNLSNIYEMKYFSWLNWLFKENVLQPL